MLTSERLDRVVHFYFYSNFKNLYPLRKLSILMFLNVSCKIPFQQTETTYFIPFKCKLTLEKVLSKVSQSPSFSLPLNFLETTVYHKLQFIINCQIKKIIDETLYNAQLLKLNWHISSI